MIPLARQHPSALAAATAPTGRAALPSAPAPAMALPLRDGPVDEVPSGGSTGARGKGKDHLVALIDFVLLEPPPEPPVPKQRPLPTPQHLLEQAEDTVIGARRGGKACRSSETASDPLRPTRRSTARSASASSDERSSSGSSSGKRGVYVRKEPRKRIGRS